MTLRPPIICLVTDRARIAGRMIVGLISDAAHAGVDLIQIRERDLDDRALAGMTRAAIGATRGTAARILLNDRVDMALATGAAGVHLRADSFDAASIRAIVPAGFIIGRSVHSEAEAAASAEAGGCDYLTFGTVFPSFSKPSGHEVAGLPALRSVCARVQIPVLAIGGVSVDRAAEVSAAGAAGVAAIGLFADALDLRAVVASLRRAFDT